MNDQKIKQIQSLTSDLIALKDFIEMIERQKEAQITAMFIKFDNSHQIELKGRFSNDSKNKLIDLIVQSRNELKSKIEAILNEITNEDETYPNDVNKAAQNASNEF